MVKRVVIDCGGISPLRVSVAGVDVDSAEFNDLIFDGNQSPLRLWGLGYAFAGGISYNDYVGGKNINEGSAVNVLATPSGTTSIFIVQVTAEGSSINASPPYLIVGTAGQTGGGGAICNSSVFIPVSMNTGLSSAPSSPSGGSWVNYAIMKNYQ